MSKQAKHKHTKTDADTQHTQTWRYRYKSTHRCRYMCSSVHWPRAL